MRAIHQELNIAPIAILTALGHQALVSKTYTLDKLSEAAPPLPRRDFSKRLN